MVSLLSRLLYSFPACLRAKAARLPLRLGLLGIMTCLGWVTPSSSLAQDASVEGIVQLPKVIPSPNVTGARYGIGPTGQVTGTPEAHFSVSLGGTPYLVFYQPLEVGSAFPAAYGVCLYSLVESQRAENILRWQIIGWGAGALVVGFALSFLLSGHLSRPVERLAEGAAENFHGRCRAEAELLATNAQLERALSELQATQAHIIQQERLRALGEMASGIAHDFNNALMPILGFSELLLGMPAVLNDREKTVNYLKTINRGARDAGNVVKRLREFYRSREEGEEFLPVDLEQLVGQIVDLTQPKWKDQALARGAAVECRIRTSPTPPVMGNESDLREALTNLVFNAVDAMPNGGRLTLTTRDEEGFAVAEVSDTGTGMSETVRRRCLEPFFPRRATKAPGSACRWFSASSSATTGQ